MMKKWRELPSPSVARAMFTCSLIEQWFQPDLPFVMKIAWSLRSFHAIFTPIRYAERAAQVKSTLELLNTLLGGKAVASDTPIPDAVAPQSEWWTTIRKTKKEKFVSVWVFKTSEMWRIDYVQNSNNQFNLTCPLSWSLLLASLVNANFTPIRFAERAAQVNWTLGGPSGRVVYSKFRTF